MEHACKICGEELYEPEPGIDCWMDDDMDILDSFIVRTVVCTGNKLCPLKDKPQEIFFVSDRIDVDNDEIDIDELKKQYEATM